MFVHPNQNVRLALQMRDDRFARWTLREMFQECWSDDHVFEAVAGMRLLFHRINFPNRPNRLSLDSLGLHMNTWFYIRSVSPF